MDNILLNRNISMTTKLRVVECYIIPVLTYASETWTISTVMEKKIGSSRNVVSKKNAEDQLDKSHNQ